MSAYPLPSPTSLPTTTSVGSPANGRIWGVSSTRSWRVCSSGKPTGADRRHPVPSFCQIAVMALLLAAIGVGLREGDQAAPEASHLLCGSEQVIWECRPSLGPVARL